MLRNLETPTRFNRNAPKVAALGFDHTGQQLIELATRECGLQSLSDAAVSLGDTIKLPVDGHFDLIGLFSVFTPLTPQDASALLRLLRSYIRPGGKLLFSAFIDPDLDGFEDRLEGRRLEHAYFGRKAMETMIRDGSWNIDRFCTGHTALPIVDYFVCSPA